MSKYRTPAQNHKYAKNAKKHSPWSKGPNCSTKKAQRVFDEFKRTPLTGEQANE